MNIPVIVTEYKFADCRDDQIIRGERRRCFGAALVSIVSDGGGENASAMYTVIHDSDGSFEEVWPGNLLTVRVAASAP